MLLQKSRVKKLINEEGIRVSPDAFEGINRAVENLLKQLCSKVLADNMKTMMMKHTPAIEEHKAESEEEKSCSRCVNIKGEFLKFARSVQIWCHEKAVVLSRHL